MTPFGRWLRAICAAQRISQAKLALRSEMNRSTLSMVGRGQYEPTLQMCGALTDGLGLPLEELLLASGQLPREAEIAPDVVAAWRDMVELAKAARKTALGRRSARHVISTTR